MLIRIDESRMTLLTDLFHLNVIGWYASEKLHGCRAYWDGKRFWTRGGNVVGAPEWFTAGLPDTPLDGEIYAGVGSFSEARVAVQFGKFSERCRFVVFDAPGMGGDWRAKMVAVHYLTKSTNATAVDCTVIESIDHLREMLVEVRAHGGEGLVLRNPAVTDYEVGRTRNVMRVKSVEEIDRLLLEMEKGNG